MMSAKNLGAGAKPVDKSSLTKLDHERTFKAYFHATAFIPLGEIMTNPLTMHIPEALPFIDVERDFDAPIEAVFRAHKEPDLIKQWLGPHGYEMEIDHYDFRSQGSYRYLHRNSAGEEFTFNGVFHVVRENEFAIQTFEFEGFPDVVSIESLRFIDLGDAGTRLQAHAVYPSLEARNGMAVSGMEAGVREGYERLDEVLKKLPN